MNQYSQLLYFLKQLAEAHPMVNTVTKGLAENIDLEKANIFPLVHITIDEANFVNGQTIGFNVTLECLTERLLNKKVVDDKFWRQDNEVDNHNETLAILNYMWTSIFRDWNENNMTTSDEPTLNKIEFAKGNILDGWAMTFQVEVPNTALSLCDITFDDIEAVVSAGTGGTVLPGVGTFTLLYGSNNAYYAEPSSGYRFLKWLYNGIESLVNPIAIKATQSYTLVANFIKQWLVTTSVNGAGTITPSSGLTDEGNITIEVTVTNPLVDEFEKIEITPDGEATQTFLTNPLTWALNKAVVIVGYVKAQFTTIMDVFTTAPTLVGNDYFIPDLISSNNVKISTKQMVKPSGVEYIVNGTKPTGGYFYFETEFISSPANVTLYSCYNNTSGEKGISIGTWSSGRDIIIYTGSGSASGFAITGFILTVGQKYKMQFTLDGITPTLLINGVSYTFPTGSGFRQWTGLSSRYSTIFAKADLTSYWDKITGYVLVENSTANFGYSFEEGYDKYVFDYKGNGNNAEIVNLQSNFWNSLTTGFKPNMTINGCTIFQQITDPTKYIYAIHDINGNPTATAITGYNKIEESSSGNVCSNKTRYLFPENTELANATELNVAGIYSYNFNKEELYARWNNCKEINITADGLGDYASIREGIMAQSGFEYVKLNVQAGTYYEQDLQGKDYLWICGHGEVIIISDGLSTAISPNDYYNQTYKNTAYNLIPTNEKHGFRIEKNTLVTGIKSIANNVKYNSHQDADSGSYNSWFIDCVFETPNVYYNIGLGAWHAQKQHYIDCTFENTSTPVDGNQSCVYWHNISNVGVISPAKLHLENCIAKTNHLLRTEDIDSNQVDLVTIVDCSVLTSGKGLKMQGSYYNIWVLAINTILQFDNSSVTRLKKLSIESGKDLYGDTDNFVEGSPYTGVTPQLVRFTELNTLLQSDELIITKTANNISQLVVRKKQ